LLFYAKVAEVSIINFVYVQGRNLLIDWIFDVGVGTDLI